MRPRLHRWARRLMWVVTAINALWLLLVVAIYAVPMPAHALRWSVSVEYRDGRPAYVFLAADDKWRLPVELEHIDPKFVEALVVLEDKRFWSHHGVDPVAIARAALTDVAHGRRISGGSTLSMQLARLLEPRPRTIPSKLVDMFRAVQLDTRMSKREILVNYLSRTPYGRNVEGLESAAWSYFGHGAQHLSPVEIATLLAVPQGPTRYAPSMANEQRLRDRRDAILGKLIAAGVFSSADAAGARVEAAANGPPVQLRPMPREAAHVAVWARDKHPHVLHVRTLLDPGVQSIVDKLVATYARELPRRSIYNAAIVVVDHRTREVVGLAGNLDFHDWKHGGQIPMFDRPRSPGSTLKPLLYALAIDRGLALPDFLVPDVPTEYGTYRPKNFDNDYSGLVTLREALGRSLNIPFVDLLAKLGVETFVGELQRSGVSHDRAKPGTFGLSLIAGGIELTPLELAGIFATLAEDGVQRPLRVFASDPAGDTSQMYGKAAAYLTRDALSQRERPDFPKRRELTGVPPQIHWKTGTSFGYRDAWSVGSGPAYTVAVWTGNVDRHGSRDLVGSEAAAPLLFDVLEGVAQRAHDTLPASRPDDLVEVEVCAYSGHIPGPGCTHRVKTLAPVHSIPVETCPYHQLIDQQSFVVLPSAVTAWLKQRNREVPEAPTSAEDGALDVGPPQVITPGEGQVVTLIPGMPAENQRLPLQASTRASTLSWFVDGELVATASASERVYWTPRVGNHDIVATDDAGRKARRKLVVRMGASQLR